MKKSTEVQLRDIENALIKRAVGFEYDEVAEEHAADKDGIMTLVKRKTVRKYQPPDISAAKLLMENNNSQSVVEMTDSQLEKEKRRLLKLLKDKEK